MALAGRGSVEIYNESAAAQPFSLHADKMFVRQIFIPMGAHVGMENYPDRRVGQYPDLSIEREPWLLDSLNVPAVQIKFFSRRQVASLPAYNGS